MSALVRLSSRRLRNAVAIRGFSEKRSSSDSNGGDVTWSWVPPKQIGEVADTQYTSARIDNDVIPVKMKTLLSSNEIVDALTKMGGIDVQRIPLGRQLDNVSEFIIASGSSTRHIRKMSDAIVQALKSRRITKAMGYKGAEGETNDDWLLVDCYDRVVHLMLPQTRQALSLEEHWKEMHQRPAVAYNKNDKEYEKGFEKLLDEHPVPDSWGATQPDAPTTRSKKPNVEYL